MPRILLNPPLAPPKRGIDLLPAILRKGIFSYKGYDNLDFIRSADDMATLM
jgi:hypothetical protein